MDGVDLHLARGIQHHLALLSENHHLRDNTPPVMEGVGGASVLSSLEGIGDQRHELNAVAPHPLQFRNHSGKAFADCTVVEVIHQQGHSMVVQGLSQGESGRYQGAISGIEGKDVAVVVIILQAGHGPGRPGEESHQKEGEDNNTLGSDPASREDLH
jgi:hypothetical protein